MLAGNHELKRKSVKTKQNKRKEREGRLGLYELQEKSERYLSSAQNDQRPKSNDLSFVQGSFRVEGLDCREDRGPRGRGLNARGRVP